MSQPGDNGGASPPHPNPRTRTAVLAAFCARPACLASGPSTAGACENGTDSVMPSALHLGGVMRCFPYVDANVPRVLQRALARPRAPRVTLHRLVIQAPPVSPTFGRATPERRQLKLPQWRARRE